MIYNTSRSRTYRDEFLYSTADLYDSARPFGSATVRACWLSLNGQRVNALSLMHLSTSTGSLSRTRKL